MPPSFARRLDEIRRCLLDTGSQNPLIDLCFVAGGAANGLLPLAHPCPDTVWQTLVAGNAVPLQAGPGPMDSDHAITVTTTASEPPQTALRALGQEVRQVRQASGVHTLHVAFGLLHYTDRGPVHAGPTRSAPLMLLPVDLLRVESSPSGMALRLRLPRPARADNGALGQRLAQLGVTLPQAREHMTPSAYAALARAALSGQHSYRIEGSALYLGRFGFGRMVMHQDLDATRWPPGVLENHPLLGVLLGTRPSVAALPASSAGRLERPCHVVAADTAQAEAIAVMQGGAHLVVQGPPGTGKSQTIANMVAAALAGQKRVLFVAQKLSALEVVQRRLQAVGLGAVTLPLFEHAGDKRPVLRALQATLTGAAAITRQDAERATMLRQTQEQAAAAMAAAFVAEDTELHAPIAASGTTAHEVMGVLAQDAPLSQALWSSGLEHLTAARFAALQQDIAAFAALLLQVNENVRRALGPCGALALQPFDLQRLQAMCGRARAQLTLARQGCAAVLRLLGCGPDITPTWQVAASCEQILGLLAEPLEPRALYARLWAAPTLTAVHEALSAGARWQAHTRTRPELPELSQELPVAFLAQTFRAAQDRVSRRFGADYRVAGRLLRQAVGRAALPRSPAAKLELTMWLQQEAQLRAAWQQHDALLACVLAEAWRGAQSDFGPLAQVAAHCLQLRALGLPVDIALCARHAGGAIDGAPGLAAVAAARQQLDELAAALKHRGWGTSDVGLERIEEDLVLLQWALPHHARWVRLCALRAALTAQGVGPLMHHLWQGSCDLAAAQHAVRHARARGLWQHLQAAHHGATRLAGDERPARMARYGEVQAGLHQLRVQELLAHHARRLPGGDAEGMEVLRAELHGAKSNSTLRQIFDALGTTLGAIKPVMLMSPLSVAQYLCPKKHRFDVVIIDEASQMRPEDALGAVARGAQLVVVGDEQQLPPSNFFVHAAVDGCSVADADAAAGDGEDFDGTAAMARPSAAAQESILTLCLARGVPTRTLTWHYRSRVPELMAVSNDAFYGGALVLPASAHGDDRAYGLQLQQVAGTYDAGVSRTNVVEAMQVARAVAQHARVDPHSSVGVVTFSLAQRRAVQRALLELQQSDPILNRFVSYTGDEAMFVKNIESVQGDERDIIFISVGYGPTAANAPLSSFAFGPINGAGGARRLNVLFTRARKRCVVFVSFAPEALLGAPSKSDGVRLLGRYLCAARRQTTAAAKVLDRCLDEVEPAHHLSPLMQDVARVVSDCGFAYSTHLGPVQLPIELAVRDPSFFGRYCLAIDGGGMTARQAFDVTRVPQVYGHDTRVLHHMGWRSHSIDVAAWLLHKEAEIIRLRRALTYSCVRRPAAADALVLPYVRAALPPQAPHTLRSDRALQALVRRVVALEGPMHVDVVAARVASCCGLTRMTASLRQQVAEAVAALQGQACGLVYEKPFCCTPWQRDHAEVRDRSGERGAVLRASHISPWELGAALNLAAAMHLGRRVAADKDNSQACEKVSTEQAQVRSAVQLLGFLRPLPALVAALEHARTARRGQPVWAAAVSNTRAAHAHARGASHRKAQQLIFSPRP